MSSVLLIFVSDHTLAIKFATVFAFYALACLKFDLAPWTSFAFARL